jgi:choline-glycine betaine transporter
METKKDRLGDIATGGFCLAVVAALLSGIQGLEWLVIVAVVGVLPFCAVALMAFVGSVVNLFRP